MAYLSTIASFGFDPMPPAQMLPLWHNLGCRTSQFYRNTANPPDLKIAKRMAQDAGVPFDSMHGIFGPDLDPSSPDEAHRCRTIDAYRAEAEIALAICVKKIIVHPSPANAGDTVLGAEDAAARQAALLRSMHELADIGDEMGVVFLLENLPLNFLAGTEPAELAQMVRQVDRPSLAMCLDTGHAQISADALDAAHQCAPAVHACHINDNDGERDQHAWPGDGTCDWSVLGPALAALPDDVPLALELFPTPDYLMGRIHDGYADRLAEWFTPNHH